MRTLETSTLRRCIGGVMLLVALLGVNVDAAAPRTEVMPQMVADTEAVMSSQAPAMGDCRPCAHCYAGPAPTLKGTSGEPKEHGAPGWTALAEALLAPLRFVNTNERRPAPVPVRIAYCRWSN